MRQLIAMACLFFCIDAQATILPPNHLDLEDNLHTLDTNIDEALFNELIDNVITVYAPLVATHSAKLSVERLWTDSTVNASARHEGSNWILKMYGGLARRPEISADAFTLVICHEIGHLVGGFAFYEDENWAAAEGQADYFAAQVCVKKLWSKADNSAARLEVESFAKAKCDMVNKSVKAQNLCYRIATAGKCLAKLLSSWGAPDFDTPDPSVVASTFTSHPNGQCRLDTYFQGALCNAKFNDLIIPGRHHADGQDSLAAQKEAYKFSCGKADGFKLGVRPACWFFEMSK